MTEQNEFQGLSDFLRLEAARITDPVCMEAAKCLRQWAKAVDSVQAARAMPADQAIAAMRDELLQMAKAASTESNPLRWAAFGHFADRVVRLAEDHKRITTHGK